MTTTTTTNADDIWYGTLLSIVTRLADLPYPSRAERAEMLSTGYYDGTDEEVA